MPRQGGPLILFAHGAGAPSSSAWMRAWAERLGGLGTVASFDYPYMQAGRKSPDKQPVLVAAHRAALAAAQARHGEPPATPVVLAGKSMGSRMGCHLAVELAAEGRGPAALVCFGYPLRSGSSGALRDEVLRALTTPILFLAGTRDPLCPLDALERVRPALRAPHQVFVVEGGNHSLEIPKRGPRTQADADAAMLAAVRAFLAEHGAGGAS
jgi:predicted alpha/beta-hydrolase family hydrolase